MTHVLNLSIGIQVYLITVTAVNFITVDLFLLLIIRFNQNLLRCGSYKPEHPPEPSSHRRVGVGGKKLFA